MQLFDCQTEAVKQMQNGYILCGDVGSGKSRTGLAHYFKEQGSDFLDHLEKSEWHPYYERVLDTFTYRPMKNPKDLYIITTAKKRDELEWEQELTHFLMSTHPEVNYYKNKIVVDSWNNIGKYSGVSGAFFLFDEQRLVGSGAWVKAFYKIAAANDWILLSATPGDTWSDYIPVFVANGFYKNKTEFINRHVIYSRFTKYPKIDRYLNTDRLIRLRNKILVDIPLERKTIPHHEDVYVSYDIPTYKDVGRTKTNPYEQGYIPCTPKDFGALLIGSDISLEEVNPIMTDWAYKPKNGDYVKFVNKPIRNASELCYIWRKVVNSSDSRQIAVMEMFEEHPRVIIFYNFDYERDILKSIYYGEDVEIAEWNGHAHQPVPTSDKWVYLVQYTAGCEGWNCITTDTIIFYSQNYSYKVMAQACGRIDRLNTPYKDLYYYHLKSRSGIDLAISRALKEKKKFNERKFTKWQD